MKKTLFAVTCILASILMFSCGSSKKEETPKVGAIGIDGSARPDWVLKGMKSDTGIYAVGSAKLSNTQNSITASRAQARNELATMVNASVQSVVRTYAEDSGKAEDTLNYMEQAIQVKTKQVISGSEVEDSWQAADETVYTLMYLPYKQMFQEAKEVVNDYVQDSKTTFTEAKAQAAFKKYFEDNQ